LRNTQQEASFVQKARWTLFDKSKADTLLKDLGWFVDELYDLAPLWVEGTIRELKISISQLSSTIDSLVLLNAPTGQPEDFCFRSSMPNEGNMREYGPHNDQARANYIAVAVSRLVAAIPQPHNHQFVQDRDQNPNPRPRTSANNVDVGVPRLDTEIPPSHNYESAQDQGPGQRLRIPN
jgi:hypothetical protein